MGRQLSFLDEPAPTPEPVAALERWALVSDGGRYRYQLGRRWAPGGETCLFVMLNPSVANADRDDPTAKKCVAFARRWGFHALEIVNLFAWISTEPSVLPSLVDPVGPDNDRHILEAAGRASRIVAAWGNHGALLGRPEP